MASWDFSTGQVLNDQTAECFLFSCKVIPRRMAVNVQNFGRFIPTATTALTVIELSLLLRGFFSPLHLSV